MKRLMLIFIMLIVLVFMPFFMRSLIYQVKFTMNLYEMGKIRNFEHASDEVIYRTNPYVFGGVYTSCKGIKRDLGCFGNPDVDSASYYCVHACKGSASSEAVNPLKE